MGDVSLLVDGAQGSFWSHCVQAKPMILCVLPKFIKSSKNSKPISASYFLTYKNNAYNLVLATDPLHRKNSPGTSLILKQIELCFKNNIDHVDFVGINSPNRGDYKLSFNSKPKIYFNLKY